MNDKPGAETPDPPASRAERQLDQDQQPATAGSVKTLRRWLIVAGVWAVAATAIGVFALVKADEADEAGAEQAAGELGRVQRNLDGRIDGLEQRIEELPTSDDLAELDSRVAEVEDGARQTGQDIDRLSGRIDELEQQVQELEDAGTGTDTETDTDANGNSP